MIGVFDSGFGGLTILKEFFRKLPDYDYIYLGDSARAPYGNKSQEVIYNYTREAVDFLLSEGCQLVILACNTASAKALRRIQQEYLLEEYPDRKVLGVAIPVAEEAVKTSKKGLIGVIGTRATAESHIYTTEINKVNIDQKRIEILEQACPLLVPLVEEGWIGRPETNMILKKYLLKLKTKQIDTLILGCTHYPFLAKDIKRIMGKNVKIIDQPAIVSDKLSNYLKKHEDIEKKLGKNSAKIFYTTDETERFDEFAKKFLKLDIKSQKINLK